ncbi:MAG: colanic acid biosynthesis protein WcaM, partial [Kluyvera sp.]
MRTFTRRHFLRAGATLAALPLLPVAARAAGQGASIDIREVVRDEDWVGAFNTAFSRADNVIVPAGVTCDNLNTAITIPPGKTLLIAGALKGNGRGR